MMDLYFDYSMASKIDVNNGCIKCIWLEDSQRSVLYDNSVMFTDGCNALIEFENGGKIIITNSEGGSINFMNKGGEG